jgi:hypothetical protein
MSVQNIPRVRGKTHIGSGGGLDLGQCLVVSIIIYMSFISVSVIYISCGPCVNNRELYTLWSLTSFMNSQIHDNMNLTGI